MKYLKKEWAMLNTECIQKEIKRENKMKRIIRKNVFETNSSSTHSLVFCTDEEYEKLKNGEMFIKCWNDELVTKDKYDEMVKQIAVEENVTEKEVRDDPYRYELPITFDEWCDCELELEHNSCTLPSGEKVHAICKYGYDS